MLNRWPPLLAGALVIALVATACDAILGGDFKVVPLGDGGSAAGGAGGSGGVVGGGGAEPLPTRFECQWTLPAHQVVASLDQEPVEGRLWQEDLFAEPFQDRLRILVARHMPFPDPPQVDGYSANPNGVLHFAFPADELLGLKRVDGLRMAALTNIKVQGTGGSGSAPLPELHLRVFDDNDAAGDLSSDLALTVPGGVLDVEDSGHVRAVFAPVGNGGAGDVGDVAFYFSYRGADTRFRAAYGYYQGAPLTPVQLLAPGAEPEERFVRASAMVHHQGVSYVITGEGEGASDGLHQFVLEPPVSSPVDPREIAGEGLVPGDLVVVEDLGNFSAGQIVPNSSVLRVLTARLPAAELGTLEAAHLLVAAEWASTAEMPIGLGVSHLAWSGNVGMFAGPPPASMDELVVLFYDALAHQRGEVHLPLDVDIDPAGNRQIEAVRVVTSGPGFEFTGGALHVVWMEQHELPGDEPYTVLFYDIAECLTAVQ